MRHEMGIAIAAFAFAAASASSASAETSQMSQSSQMAQQSAIESERLPRGTVKAPSNAFEIQLSTGYAQGFGPQIPAKGTLPSTSLDRPGMGAGLGLAYRATPHASVGLVGTYSMQDSAEEFRCEMPQRVSMQRATPIPFSGSIHFCRSALAIACCGINLPMARKRLHTAFSSRVLRLESTSA